MDDDRPLFSTFKPIGEDNTASAKPGPDTTPVQPQGAEQPPGHHDTDGRVGHRAVKGLSPPAPRPCAPELMHPQGPCPPGLHPEPRAGSRASSGHVLTRAPIRSPLPSRSCQAAGHPHRAGPGRSGTRSRSWWPCVPGRGCGSSRHKPGGWGPRASSQPGSTASSAGGERGLKPRQGTGWPLQHPHPWAPK